ncbi:MAG: SHOCT domain-containing protein [uncultured Thiotrichaceae bacterium]|uniref:SHOCT domain-containing protein n=1 Tax=uncultured Thiotrichaceae bacterium TaxID=298394 RepID=A0A6S6TFM9_9GAMM|nr:MAG: SHOCT domain-containing protein [uncultured Thiotrichaceae bacterium]
MQQLTQAGQNLVSRLSQHYGFSSDAVTHMLFAVLNGNGSMAQFNHSEFGGSGQWMRGGMLMLGDMFNSGLKGSVDGLCNDISDTLAREPGLLQTGSFQSQSQGDSANQRQTSGGTGGNGSSLFVPDPDSQWWPQELGTPNATGSQNNARYAYFANNQRLAVDTNGQVWVYNTLDHQIGGFSQQQGSGGNVTFSSQYGSVNLSSLPIISINGQPVPAPVVNNQAAPAANESFNPFPEKEQSINPNSQIDTDGDILSALERLGGLLEKGILTNEEFTDKKTELLQRL